MIPETGDDANQRGGRFGVQLEFLLKVELACALPAEVLPAEVLGQVLVFAGIPFVEVDAVEDAVEAGLPSLHDVLEAEAKGRREDFLRVSRADGDDARGVKNAAFKEVHAAQAFEFFGFKQPFGQA